MHHAVAAHDVDLWELHEAYAVTTPYNQAQLETPWETINVNGGAGAHCWNAHDALARPLQLWGPWACCERCSVPMDGSISREIIAASALS